MKSLKSSIAFWIFLLIGSAALAQSSDPVIMKINGKSIPRSEFEYMYNKNNSGSNLDNKSLDDYANLFVDFRLKVEEALTQKLDTQPSFIKELTSYQKQLEEPYLQDTVERNRLVNEAYDRIKNEVQVSHILIKIPGIGNAADTLEAYNKAMDIWKKAQKGDFTKLAKEYSEDPSVQKNDGNVGWITALHTPYAFETAAFETPVGAVSKPVRTYLGYHLIKVTNKRPSRGEVLAAHIMKFVHPDSIKAQSKITIDSIYQRVLAGDDFAILAQKYSDDKGSARNGGKLGWFGVKQRMVPEFEDAAFALKNVGDVSQPVLSYYGYHIIKLLDKRPLANFDKMRPELLSGVMNDARSKLIKESFIKNTEKEYGFTLNNAAVQEFKNIANKYVPTDSMYKVKVSELDKPLFTIGDKSYNQSDFGEFLLQNPSVNGIQADFINDKLNDFVAKKVTDYELAQLDKKYPEYHYLMKEYHDGILLFDISNKEVWDRASNDTKGLKKYFEENRENYVWEKPHYKGNIIYCKDKATLKTAKVIAKNASPDSLSNYLNDRLNDSIKYVKVVRGLWTQGEDTIVDKYVFKKGKFEPTAEYPYVFVSGNLLKKYPETYEDVRGAVITDYQNYLEKEWIKLLRKKYPVWIDENVLKTVNKN